MVQSNALATALALLFLGGSLVAWTWLGIRLAMGQPVLPPPQPRVAPWRLNGVVAAVLLWLLLMQAIPEVILPLLRGDDPAEAGVEQTHRVEQFILLAIINGLILLLVPLLLRALARARLEDLGLTVREFAWNVARGAVACLIVSPLVYAINWLAVQYWPVSKHPLEKMVVENPSGPVALLAVISGVLLAPAAEELFFRGVLLGWLHRVANPPKPVVLTVDPDLSEPIAGDVPLEPSVPPEEPLLSSPPIRPRLAVALPNLAVSLVFAGIHWAQFPAPLALFVLSWVLGVLYQRTGSLVAPITLHSLFNGTSTLALFLTVH